MLKRLDLLPVRANKYVLLLIMLFWNNFCETVVFFSKEICIYPRHKKKIWFVSEGLVGILEVSLSHCTAWLLLGNLRFAEFFGDYDRVNVLCVAPFA